MYQINDMIIYGVNDICKIVDIADKDFSGSKTEYYVLKPLNNQASTIYVPVNNENLKKKMRCVLSVSEIYEIIHSMPEEKSVWIENENERKEKYKEIIACGNRRELVQIIKALYTHQQQLQAKGKKLHAADERFFKEAEKLLYEEFAIVLDIKQEQVLPFILEQIQPGLKHGYNNNQSI